MMVGNDHTINSIIGIRADNTQFLFQLLIFNNYKPRLKKITSNIKHAITSI